MTDHIVDSNKKVLTPRAMMWLRELREFGEEVRVQPGFMSEFSKIYRVKEGCVHPRRFFPKDVLDDLLKAKAVTWDMHRYHPAYTPVGRKAVTR